MPNSPIQIAIDGFAGCGKSTLAKRIAQEFKLKYVDSGAMYRCVALYIFRQNIDFKNQRDVETALQNIAIRLESKDSQYDVFLNGEDVSADIRKPDILPILTQISSIAEVRHYLVEMQKKMGENESIIMDGRDIGTVVFPNAQIKIFVTASVEERARRRFAEFQQKGIQTDLKKVMEELSDRDHKDSTRSIGPLVKADDAIVLDNTQLNQDEQFEVAKSIILKKTDSLK